VVAAVGGGWILTGGELPGVEQLDWPWNDSTAVRHRATVHLAVTSQPAQATVVLDGHERGKTPLDISVAPGTHALILKHPDTLDEQRQLSVSSDTSVSVSLWRRRPDAVQLRPAYPGASVADAIFLADGRVAVALSLPGEGAGGGSGANREAWIFDPAAGTLDPFAEGANHRARVLTVSPDGRRLAYLEQGPGTGQAGGATRLTEVWVVGGAGDRPPQRVFALAQALGEVSIRDVEELRDLTWTRDGQHLLVTASLVQASGGYAAASRSRLLLVSTGEDGNEHVPEAAAELAVIPADVVASSYDWAPDGRWVAFLTLARVTPGSGGFVALCALDTGAGGASSGFRYIADLAHQIDPGRVLPVAAVAWAPALGGGLVYAAPTPRFAVSNPLGLPVSAGGEPGLFITTPTGPALSAEEGRRLGAATGFIAPSWLSAPGPDGDALIALARSDRGNKPLVVRGVDTDDGAVRTLGIELPAGVGGSGAVTARWDPQHGRALVLAPRSDGAATGLLDYWLVQLRSTEAEL
jgi:hypothetical protein